MKKWISLLISLLLVAITIFGFQITVFADPNDNFSNVSVEKSAAVQNNGAGTADCADGEGQKMSAVQEEPKIDPYFFKVEAVGNDSTLLKLTAPDTESKTINKDANVVTNVTFGGISEKGTEVYFMVYSEADQKYKLLYDTNNQCSFVVGDFGIFVKEIPFAEKGTYKVRVLAVNGDRNWIVNRQIVVNHNSDSSKETLGIGEILNVLKGFIGISVGKTDK